MNVSNTGMSTFIPTGQQQRASASGVVSSATVVAPAVVNVSMNGQAADPFVTDIAPPLANKVPIDYTLDVTIDNNTGGLYRDYHSLELSGLPSLDKRHVRFHR